VSRTPTPEEAQRAIEDDAAEMDGGPWDEPVPVGVTGPLAPFPVDALPDWAATMVERVAEETQTPPDLAGAVFLGVIATAAGGRAIVEVRSGWIEPLNLYTVSAMPPGSRKSAVFRQMTAPVLQAEGQLREQARTQIQEQAVSRAAADEAARRATLEAGKHPGDEHKLADAISAAQLAESITIPAWPRLIADDATPEAIASLLAQQRGRLAILSAEGDIFDVMSGRYTEGRVQNTGVFLKGHAGDLLLIDRKGREPERIERPALTLGLCIQPQVLMDIAKRPVLRGRGLLARVLYSLPPDVVGYRKITPDTVSPEVRELYEANVRSLVLSLAEWTDPAVLPVTPGAADVLASFQERTEPRLRSGTGDLDGLRDWASKLVGAVVRLAGLLHLAEHLKDGWGQPIESVTMERAVRFGEYFTEHARAAFDRMGADPIIDDARFILGWITRVAVREFTKRELHMGVYRGRFPKATDLDPPLALLEQHGYIRLMPEPERSGAGRRPSPRYAVHPSIATISTEST
jgi:hypothetical protein